MKTGRNDPCPCGSGKKFKKCCLGKTPSNAGMPPGARPNLPQVPAPPPPDRTPARAKEPSKPRDPAEERWDATWNEFESQQGDGRRAIFLHALPDKELMLSDAAFEMLSVLRQDAVALGERRRFAELVGVLADQRPDLYRQDAHYYLAWQLADALAESRADILPLVREVAGQAGQHLDTVNRALVALAYHGHLTELVEAMRIGWPLVQASDDILPWGTVRFSETGVSYEIYASLEQTPRPDPTDSALLERIKFFIAAPRLDFVAQFISDLTDQDTPVWSVSDFTLKPAGKQRRRDEWDDEEEEREEPPDAGAANLSRLIAQFVGYLRRVEGVPYPKGELVRHELYRYFLARHEGDLAPRLSMLDQALHPKKKLPPLSKPGHSLCPERVTFEVCLAQLLGFMSGRYHTAAALFEIVPAWLRFLESKGLIDGERHAKTLDELRPLHVTLLQGMKSHTDDPTLYRDLQGWPTPAANGQTPAEPPDTSEPEA